MTALTAAQISAGAKNAKAAPPADVDRPGRWLCCLCGSRRHSGWKRGTLRDAFTHYLAAHYTEGDTHGST